MLYFQNSAICVLLNSAFQKGIGYCLTILILSMKIFFLLHFLRFFKLGKRNHGRISANIQVQVESSHDWLARKHKANSVFCGWIYLQSIPTWYEINVPESILSRVSSNLHYAQNHHRRIGILLLRVPHSCAAEVLNCFPITQPLH